MLYALDKDELKQLQTADWSADFTGLRFQRQQCGLCCRSALVRSMNAC